MSQTNVMPVVGSGKSFFLRGVRIYAQMGGRPVGQVRPQRIWVGGAMAGCAATASSPLLVATLLTDHQPVEQHAPWRDRSEGQAGLIAPAKKRCTCACVGAARVRVADVRREGVHVAPGDDVAGIGD